VGLTLVLEGFGPVGLGPVVVCGWTGWFRVEVIIMLWLYLEGPVWRIRGPGLVTVPPHSPEGSTRLSGYPALLQGNGLVLDSWTS